MTGTVTEPDIVRAQLHRILTSPAFDASERNCSFFEYVVEEALAGRADRLKAYNIATTVFGRDPGFDAQNDPVVRIEARRLRRSLEHYYLTAGKNDDLVISIPKGGYAPHFRMYQMNEPVAADELERVRPEIVSKANGSSPGGPVIYVAGFEEEGDQSAFSNFTHGFTRSLIVALTRFTDLVVYGTETSLSYGPDVSLDRLLGDLRIDFLVRGGVAISQDHFDVEVLLIDARTGQSVWAECYGEELKPRDIVAVRDAVANRIARTVAQPFGVIFGHKAQETEGKLPDDLESYEAVIKYYLYWQSVDRDSHVQARVALEQAIARNPDYADALACLSRVYTDAWRFGFESGLDEEDPLDKALALARRAIELAPTSSRGHRALGLAYWFIGDIQTGLASLETALSLNPNNTEIMADLGMHYLMLTEWDKGAPLLEEAYQRNPALPGNYRAALSLFHLAHDRYEEAFHEARKITAPGLVYGPLLEAAAAAGLGLQKETASAISAVTAIDADYGQHIIEDLQKRNLHPDLIEMLLDLMHRAGLPGCERSGAKITSHLTVVTPTQP